MKLKPTKMFIRGCLVLTIALAASSKTHDDTLESKSIDSMSLDSGSLEDRVGYEHEVPYLEMRGNLRKTMAYHVLLKDTSKSWVVSPLSALLPLGKLAIGSSSRRYRELKEAIGYKRIKIRKRFKEIMDRMAKIGGKLALVIASRLYVSIDETVMSKFLSTSREAFKSGCEKVNFRDPSGTARKINSWVAYETNEMIRNVIEPSEISRTSSLIMINAVYFTGAWRNSFDSVKPGIFYTASRQKEIKMMYTKGRYKYFKSSHLKAQIVEIPYSGKGVSMIVVLPLDTGGLPALLHQLANLPESLNSYMKQMRKTTLKLAIPKFRIATYLHMDDIYKKIGLKEIFNSGNKVLTKIVRGHSVFVTKSNQAAIIDVDKHGSDGGVITMQLEKPGHDNDKEGYRIEFKANHPFLFFVVANEEQLFAGTYVGDSF